MTTPADAASPDAVREEVRSRYAAAAQAVTTGGSASCGAPRPAGVLATIEAMPIAVPW